MTFSLRLPRRELAFGLVISSIHSVQHLFYRLLPPLIPLLALRLDIPLWQLGLLASVYLFAGGIGQAPMGILADRIDRMYVIVPAIAVMAVGYLLFAASPALGPSLLTLHVRGDTFTGTYQLMLIGMFVAGIGYSAVHPVGYPLISSNISEENKGKVLGMWGSASKVGDTVAPVLVALLILVVSWELIIVAICLFGLLYAVALSLFFRRFDFDTRPPEENPHLSNSGSDSEWKVSPRRFVLQMGVILFAFCCVLFATNGLITFVPVFVTDVYAYSVSMGGFTLPAESVANVYFSAFLISGALSQLAAGALADVFDQRLLIVCLLCLSATGVFVLALATLNPITLLFVFVCLGGTIFGLNPVRDSLISQITPAAYEGRTFGYFWTIILLVGSAYPVVIGYLADEIGIRASFSYLGIALLLGIACIGLLYSPRIYREPTSIDS